MMDVFRVLMFFFPLILLRSLLPTGEKGSVRILTLKTGNTRTCRKSAFVSGGG